MEVQWKMSETESRTRARELAIEKLRTQAAQEVGQVVEMTSSMKDGDLKEEVRLITVSMIAVEVMTERVTVNPDGSTTLNIKAKVSVDHDELRRRAAALRTDTAKVRQIRDLAEENRELRRKLVELASGKGSEASAAAAHSDLRSRRSALNGKVESLFAAGSMQELAVVDGEDWDKQRRALDQAILDPLARTAVKVSLASVTEERGGVFTARVKVDWRHNMPELWKALLRMNLRADYSEGDRGNLVSVDVRRQSLGGRDVDSTSRMVGYLTSSSVHIEVEFAGQKAVVPVLYGRDFGFTPRTSCQVADPVSGAHAEVLCISEYGSKISMVPGSPVDELPLKFRVSQEQATKPQELRAYVVTSRPGVPTTKVQVH